MRKVIVNLDGTITSVGQDDPLTQEDYDIELVNFLDREAQKTQWDNMLSARSASGIPLDTNVNAMVVGMHTDAIRLANLYLRANAFAIDLLGKVQTGIIAQPTLPEFNIMLQGV